MQVFHWKQRVEFEGGKPVRDHVKIFIYISHYHKLQMHLKVIKGLTCLCYCITNFWLVRMPLQRKMGSGTKNAGKRKLNTVISIFRNVTPLYSVLMVQRCATVYTYSMCLNYSTSLSPSSAQIQTPVCWRSRSSSSLHMLPSATSTGKECIIKQENTTVCAYCAVTHIQVNLHHKFT